jgi:hypothetical protein
MGMAIDRCGSMYDDVNVNGFDIKERENRRRGVGTLEVRTSSVVFEPNGGRR